MDIEGGDLLALQGATRILEAGTMLFLIELPDFSSHDAEPIPRAVRALMRRYGYRGLELQDTVLFVKSAFFSFALWTLQQLLKDPLWIIKRGAKRMWGLTGRQELGLGFRYWRVTPTTDSSHNLKPALRLNSSLSLP